MLYLTFQQSILGITNITWHHTRVSCKVWQVFNSKYFLNLLGLFSLPGKIYLSIALREN